MPFEHDPFKLSLDRAAKEYNQRVAAAERSGGDLYGFVPSTLEHQRMVCRKKRAAALDFVGAVLFAFLADPAKSMLMPEERHAELTGVLSSFRKVILDRDGWPRDLVDPSPSASDFDTAMVAWLEDRPEWQEYEVRVAPLLGGVIADPEGDPLIPSPVMYFASWPVSHLNGATQQGIRSGLLKIHGRWLDARRPDPEDYRRQAFHLIADQFERAEALTEEVVRVQVPGMVADADGGAGWSPEPRARRIPSALFSERLGSLFYLSWRRSEFLECLSGRITHWMAHVSPPQSGRRGRKPQTEAHKRVAAMVRDIGDGWRNDVALKRLAEWMDSEGIPLDASGAEDGVVTWLDRLDLSPPNFVKAIEYRLRAKK